MPWGLLWRAGLLSFGYPVFLMVLTQPLMWHWVQGGFPALAGVLLLAYSVLMSCHLHPLLGLHKTSPSLVMLTCNAAALAHTAFVLWVGRSSWWLAAQVAAMVGHFLYEMTSLKRSGAQPAPWARCLSSGCLTSFLGPYCRSCAAGLALSAAGSVA